MSILTKLVSHIVSHTLPTTLTRVHLCVSGPSIVIIAITQLAMKKETAGLTFARCVKMKNNIGFILIHTQVGRNYPGSSRHLILFRGCSSGQNCGRNETKDNVPQQFFRESRVILCTQKCNYSRRHKPLNKPTKIDRFWYLDKDRLEFIALFIKRNVASALQKSIL